MPYTLLKYLGWLIAALLIGLALGYALSRRRTPVASSPTTVDAEMERLRGRVANLEAAVRERDRLGAELDECRAAAKTRPAAVAGRMNESAEGEVPPSPDVHGAQTVLGYPIKLDDLKVVEGIGPKIEDLIRATGVTTWWALANTDVAALRRTLDAAGPQFKIHDPRSWPQQARLLAEGNWTEFKRLIDSLDAGRPAG